MNTHNCLHTLHTMCMLYCTCTNTVHVLILHIYTCTYTVSLTMVSQAVKPMVMYMYVHIGLTTHPCLLSLSRFADPGKLIWEHALEGCCPDGRGSEGGRDRASLQL